MTCVFGGVNDLIRCRPDALHRLAFRPDRFTESVPVVGRMRTPCLAESSRQDLVRGLKEKHRNSQPRSSQCAQLLRKVRKKLSFAKTNNQRSTLDASLFFVPRLHQPD